MFRNLSVSFFCLLTPVSFCGVKRIFHLSFGQLSLGGITAQIAQCGDVLAIEEGSISNVQQGISNCQGKRAMKVNGAPTDKSFAFIAHLDIGSSLLDIGY
jgi:hypothetical protein